MVEAIFMSALDYDVFIYVHASKSSLKTLDTIYHSATGDPFKTHHYILCQNGWKTFYIESIICSLLFIKIY